VEIRLTHYRKFGSGLIWPQSRRGLASQLPWSEYNPAAMSERSAEIGKSLIGVALVILLAVGVREAYVYRRDIFLVVLLSIAALADLWKYWIGPLVLRNNN
jgi:hypothetical protein